MADYTQNTTFATKDALVTGDAEKIILGSDFDGEFSEIAARSADKEDTSNKGAASGYAPLDSGSLVPVANLPAATTSAVGVLEIATELEAEGLTLDTKYVTPLALDRVFKDNGGMLGDIQALADPGADTVLGWDDSVNAAISFTLGTGLTSSGTALTTDDAAIVLSALSGYDANEHIDHSAVSVTAGNGLTGGGTTAATRTLTAVGTNGVSVGVGGIQLAGVSASATSPITVASGTFGFDLSSITELTMPNFSQSADKFVVSDAGVVKVIPYASAGIKVATVTGTTDTLATSDMNTFIEYTNAAAVAVTLNTGVGTVGNALIIKQTGAGQVSVSGTATFESAGGEKTRTTDSVITLLCIAADTWAVYGDAAA